MEHMDESILKAKRELEQAEAVGQVEQDCPTDCSGSIYDDFVDICKIPTRFAEHEILDGAASIRMPVDFEPRSEEEIKCIFISGNPPKVLYGNSYAYFMVAFNLTEHKISPTNLADFMSFAKQMMERMGPKSHVIKSEMAQCAGGQPIAVMDLISNAIQGSSYSVIFYSVVEDHLLIGSIQFGNQYAKEIAPLAHEIVSSFSIKQREDDQK